MRPEGKEEALSRLASTREAGGGTYLQPYHTAAAAHLEQLIRRAQLAPRVTMSYSAASVRGGNRSGNHVETASDGAADARLKLSRLASMLPADCWGVLFDVCGLGKGLQLIETERRWPRRSAKLVLRIGLEQLAAQLGLSAVASGADGHRTRRWLDRRLPLIADDPP